MNNQKFRRYQLGDQSGIGSLSIATHAAREPGPGEVVIQTMAAALNYRDLMIAQGRYGERKPDSRIPLGDGAGAVLAVGEGVYQVQPGDRVTAPHFLEWLDGDYDPAIFGSDAGNTADGWLAERVWMPARSLVKVPDDMSYQSAAALGAAGITAWRVLEVLGNIKSGDTVLTLGTGGVSILALQIASMNGARVAITSSSDSKLGVAKKLGADITVNYRKEPEWQEAVRAATGGHGVDIVVETVGMGTLAKSIQACAPNARIGLLGALQAAPESMPNLMPLYMNNITVQGVTSGSRRMLDNLIRASAANGMAPHIDKVFGFDRAGEAYAYLAEAGHVGKVVITANE